MSTVRPDPESQAESAQDEAAFAVLITIHTHNAAATVQNAPDDLVAAVAAQLARQHAPTTGPSTPDEADKPDLPSRVATILLALEDVDVRDQCLAWTDPDAGQLWQDLLRCAPPGWRAPAATALAVHAYINHDPTLASTALRYALADRPDYSLAHTVPEVMAIGTDPTVFADIVQQRARMATIRADHLDARR